MLSNYIAELKKHNTTDSTSNSNTNPDEQAQINNSALIGNTIL